MDGTIVNHSKYQPNSKKIRIQFKLSKKRKILKLIHLLKQLEIDFTFKKATKSPSNKLQPFYIRIYGDYSKRIFKQLNGMKQFPEWFKELDEVQTHIILKTILETDGSLEGRYIKWTSSNENNINIIKHLSQKFGFEFYFKCNCESGFKKGKMNPTYKIGLF